MVEVGRDFWDSSGPTHLLKQGHLQLIAKDHAQTSSEWRHHNISGQSVPVLSCPHSEKVFPGVEVNLLCFSVCPLPPVLLLGTTRKSLALSLHVFIIQ